MTDAQRDELERLRMKAASPEMVTVTKELLRAVLNDASLNNDIADDVAKDILSPELRDQIRGNLAVGKAQIAELRAIAGIK
jgi:hypothetical protein